MVSRAPTALRRETESRFQTRRQSEPSWVAEKPNWDGAAVAAPPSPKDAVEFTSRNNGRQKSEDAAMARRHGASHHQLMPFLGGGDSRTSAACPVRTMTIFLPAGSQGC